jgi:DNA repair exonuclease SbcCD nuclease subunit
MRALCYADLQATDGHEKCHGDPTVPLQIARVDAFYGMLLKIYEENKCDCLWDLGDTTDDRSSIPVPAIDTVCGNLMQFPKNQWNLKLIGNHEQYLRNTHVHVGQMFAPYFTVVTGNEAFVVPGAGVRIAVCSYPADERDTVTWLREQHKQAKQAKQKTVLLGHFQVMGCMTGAGQLLAGVPKDEITWVDLGLLGHVHKPQSLHKNVHYIGSPFQQDWGESGEDKRVAIVDISSDGKIAVKWLPIDGFPQYLQVSVSEFEELCTSESEDRYKVILKSQTEATKFYAMPLAHRAEPIYDFDVTANATGTNCGSDSTTGALNTAWTFDNVIQRYVENNTPESRGIPSSVEEMVVFGHEIALK